MSATSTPGSARFDLPPAPSNATPTATDTALAEWTNRIKAMQRQVDADDEAEQRRLEEEIMRARLARMRRGRTGQSGDFGVGMHGIDLSKPQEGSQRTVDADLGASASDKPSSMVPFPKPVKKAIPAGEKPALMSLAAFMGGNASGPRLRRHEPQLDAGAAYDGRVDHGTVHPIFGRGGVAMPGMVGRETHPTSPPPSASRSVPQPTPSNASQAASSQTPRTRTLSTSNVARRYVEKIEEQTSSQSLSPKPSGLGIRERRQSTPNGTFSEPKVATTIASTSHLLPQNPGGRAVSPAKSPNTESRPKTPSVADIRPKTPITSEARPKTPVADPLSGVEVRSKAPSMEFHVKAFVEDPRAKTPGTDTTRAKTPIQSSPTRASFPGALPWQTPRHQPSTQLPSTSTIPPKSPGPPSPMRGTYAPQPQRSVAPAFLRPPGSSSAKDPTPSISRLQGRGFVQSIVQASDRISGDSPASQPVTPKHVFPSSSPVPNQGGGEIRERGVRRASVLDRWTPVMNATSAPSSPLPATKIATPTRSYTPASMKAIQGQDIDISVVKTHDTGRSVRSAVSLPAIPKTPHKKADGLPAQDTDSKLGSSSTMISYIKPTKTGDDPVVPDVDEMGVKAAEAVQTGGVRMGTAGSGVNYGAVPGTPGKAKTPRVSASPLPLSPGKPLSHPTKDRAKKPRKTRFEEGASVIATPRDGSSRIGTKDTTQSPNLAMASSTGIAPGLPATSTPPASFGPEDAQSKTKGRVKSSTTGKVTDRWTEPTLIGVKSTQSSSGTTKVTTDARPAGTSIVGRRPLPGLANPTVAVVVDKNEKTVSKDKEQRTVPPSPPRHARIPSTGNRALVMDVAQALTEAAHQHGKEDEREEKEVVATPAAVRELGLGGAVGEKRKSSYERYAAVAMPPLVEERTPVASPVNTIPRGVGQIVSDGKVTSESPLNSLHVRSGTVEQLPSPSSSSKVFIDHVDEPLPRVDIAALLSVQSTTSFVPNPDLRTVSVEVMSIVHTNAVLVQRDVNIFYDTEVLVIVHRAKSRESGLAATKVWCWKGKKCHFEEREEKKVGELAKRYGTSANVVHQQHEHAELIYILGGLLAIRQGSRAHWSSENTAMHVVKSNDGHILIDEIDLNVRNLCSGYSYCISILDNIYVWHGCGSVSAERSAALRYAHAMAAKGTSVKELVEGENDGDDEMFWMVVGDSDSYAKADYWKWRRSVIPSEPRCWLVDVANSDVPIRPVPTVSAETVQQESVYIIDCFWEFFVLVGKDARAKRRDITLAINSATAMAPLVATSKPFSPTVHVLILPTQLPLDMRHAFRNLDELELNGGFVPDHMNILSAPEAIEHLRTSLWDRSALRDHTMLPLGLDSSHVPLP